ncbi:uncharacterized protein LOC124353466 [Homalodisca vitripennis]|uniref:uncharacterized protein LOC124353466 n=1 Tax=Homalodisca vitripennis TaxID=197043 RepID=UPI001EEC12B2|nr:uncharacterized protein LOC124353466 [Homalodisca vitripennis]
MMFYWTLLVTLSVCDVFPPVLAVHCTCDCSKCFLNNNKKDDDVSISTSEQSMTGEPGVDSTSPRSRDVNLTSQLYNTSLASSPDHDRVALRSMAAKAKSVTAKSTPTEANPIRVRKLAKRGKTKKQRMMEEEVKTTRSPPVTRNESTSLNRQIPSDQPPPPQNTEPKTKLGKGKATEEVKSLVDLVSNKISQSILQEQEAMAKEGVTNERLSQARLQMATFETVKRLDKPLEDIGRLTGDATTAVKVIENAVANNAMFRQATSDNKALSSRSGQSSIISLSPITKDYITMIMS